MKYILLALAVSTFSAIADEYPVVPYNKVFFADEQVIFNFPFDQSNVTPEQKQAFLDKATEFGKKLAENPNWVLRIEGHTDETGTEMYNMGLAKRRISELTVALIKGGAQYSQIQGVPYGEINPLVDGHSDTAWKTNRRIVARLIINE